MLRFILALFTAPALCISALLAAPPIQALDPGFFRPDLGLSRVVAPRVAEASAEDGTARLEPVDVALDPGHSSWDVGASAGGLREFELTLDVAERVQARLLAAGRSARLTRQDSSRIASFVPSEPTSAIQTEQEARIAAAGPARAYVSIHFNGHPDSRLRGTETYFNSDNRGAASAVLAASLQRSTLAALAAAGYESIDRGVKEDLTAGKPYGHFFSLRGPFPSALIETLFLSNAGDAAFLRQEGARDAVAEGITRGIISFLDGEEPS